jgi:signal transduction histidine kinase
MPESADDPAAAMPQAIPAEELAAKEASWLEIEVSDTGCGISDDVLADIFEPFFTTKRGGTGLGLPTVHRIVENHGGELQLDSQLGLGTIFRIRLPGVEVAG